MGISSIVMHPDQSSSHNAILSLVFIASPAEWCALFHNKLCISPITSMLNACFVFCRKMQSNDHSAWSVILRNETFANNQPILSILSQTCNSLRKNITYSKVVMHFHTTSSQVNSAVRFLAHQESHHPSTLSSVGLFFHGVEESSLQTMDGLRPFTWRDLDIRCKHLTATHLLLRQTPSMLTRLVVRDWETGAQAPPAPLQVLSVTQLTSLVSLHLFTYVYRWHYGFGSLSHLTELKLLNYPYESTPPLPNSLVSFGAMRFYRHENPVRFGHLTKLTSLCCPSLPLEQHDELPPNLQGLTMCSARGSIMHLTGITSLKELSATSWVSSVQQMEVIKGLTHITSISMGYKGNQFEPLPPLASWRLVDLHALSLSNVSLLPAVCLFVQGLSVLRSLSFECIGQGDAIGVFVSSLTSLTTLETLKIRSVLGVDMYRELCSMIPVHLTKITHLSLPPMNFGLCSIPTIRVRAAFKQCVHGLSGLKYLSIRGTELSSSDVCAVLKPCYSLESFDMTGCDYAIHGFAYDRIDLMKLLAMSKPPYHLRYVSFDRRLPLQQLHDHGLKELVEELV